jgi:hypothetical protein
MARAVHPCADLWYKNAAMDLVQTLSTVVSLVGLVVVILAALWWRPRALVFQEGLCNACGYTIAETDTDRCSECGSPLAVQRAAVEQRVRARLVCGLIAIASCCVQMVVVPRLDKERWVPQVFRWEMGGSILLLPVRFVGSNGGWRSRGESDNIGSIGNCAAGLLCIGERLFDLHACESDAKIQYMKALRDGGCWPAPEGYEP